MIDILPPDRVKRVSTGYSPRPFQDFIHRNKKRFNVLLVHRRGGKTVGVINDIYDMALRNELPNPHYAYIAPTYGQAKRVSWEYFLQYGKNIPGFNPKHGDLTIEIERPGRGDKITIWLLGSENPHSIRGLYLDGAVIDEYADCSPIVWDEVVRPCLSDRKGWVIFIGTVRGMNHLWKQYEQAKEMMKKPGSDWFAVNYTVFDTDSLPPEEIESIRATMSEDAFKQEYLNDPTAALVGAYYGKEIKALEDGGRITNVPYDPAISVDTFWDLGIGDTTAIWFLQQVGREKHIIDHIEMSGVGLDWYARELKTRPYVYGEHYVPHDAAAKELGTGRTRVETLRALGLKPLIVLPKWRIEDGINAVRLLLPLCWFDKHKCERGLFALKSYEKQWDSKNQIFMDVPKHNWASNSSDAFRYLAMGLVPNERRENMRNLPRKAKMIYNIFGR